MNLTVATRKGGSGKSTITTNIAALRKIRGHDIGLVDTDDQKSSAMWCASRGQNEKLPYIPCVCLAEPGVGQAINAQSKKYTDLIIDVPGRDAGELRTAILVSDVVALPLRPSNFDIWAFEKDLAMISDAKVTKDAVNMSFRAFIFFNGISTNPSARTKEIASLNEFLDEYKDEINKLNIEISPHYVSNRGAYNRAVDGGMSVHEFGGTTNSDENARHEIEQLYKFIYGSNK